MILHIIRDGFIRFFTATIGGIFLGLLIMLWAAIRDKPAITKVVSKFKKYFKKAA